MKYETLYEVSDKLAKSLGPDRYYECLYKYTQKHPNEHMKARGMMEHAWYLHDRPFYKVWPSIQPILEATKLDFRLDQTDLKPQVFALYMETSTALLAIMEDKSVCVLVVHASGDAVLTTIPSNDTIDIEDAAAEYPEAVKVVRCAIGVALLENDPDVIEPAVLNRDRLKPFTPKLVEKARKRGVNGFFVGRKFETIPHYRRPHFAYRWCGPGKKIKRLRPIKGTIVHRKDVTTVPTGREGA